VKWKVGDRVETRDAYGDALVDLGKRRPDVVVMDSDLQRSNKTYAFGQAYPHRFFDMGIAEADMVCTAAGMAATGMTVFATSFAMFVPGRCYDQIRLQLGYGQANVKIVGVSAGLTQGPDGATHQALDDIALTRQLPGLTVLSPADATEAYQAVLAAADLRGPVYLRMGRYPTRVIFGEEYRFQIGAVPVLRQGKDVALFATGIMTAMALDTADILAGHGVEASVLNVPTIKPLNREAILAAAAGQRLAVAMEEHSIVGGLGSAIAETLAESRGVPPLLRIGVHDCFGQSGSADELLDHYGLTPKKMAAEILDALNVRGGEQLSVFRGLEHPGLYPYGGAAPGQIAEWYAQMFGFEVVEGPTGFFLSGSGPGRIEVMKQGDTNRCHLAIEVSDFEAAVAALQAKGIELEPPRIFPDLKAIWLKQSDPAGNQVHLIWRK